MQHKNNYWQKTKPKLKWYNDLKQHFVKLFFRWPKCRVAARQRLQMGVFSTTHQIQGPLRLSTITVQQVWRDFLVFYCHNQSHMVGYDEDAYWHIMSIGVFKALVCFFGGTLLNKIYWSASAMLRKPLFLWNCWCFCLQP